MKRLLTLLAALALAGSAQAQDPGIGYTPPASSGSSTDLTAANTLGTAYGADMVTNGTFTGNATGWTLGGAGGAPDWAYATNNVTHANGGGTATLEPSTPLTVVAGRTYRITFTLSGLTAGTVTASIGGASATAASTNGTFVQTIVATDTTNLKFTPTTTLVATIDTVSVEESKSVTVANLTATRIPFATTGGRLTDSSFLTADDAGGGNGAFVFRKTNPAAAGDNQATPFFALSGTMTNASGSVLTAAKFNFTSLSSSGNLVLWGLNVPFNAGYTGPGNTAAVLGANNVAGTGTDISGIASPTNGPNMGVYGQASATTTGSNVAVVGRALGGNISIGGHFYSVTTKNSATNAAVVGQATNAGSSPTFVAGYFALSNVGNPTVTNSALQASNGSIAAPIIVAQDNFAALPTTSATATWQVMDGGWSQEGNAVLTSGTATAETQARNSGAAIHSCTWTNAQVVALGASTTGDISCFTLPAKTVVKNAYLVITGQAGTVSTLTAAVGRVSAGYIDYIVASDAKVAAGTRYGEDAADRGTNLTGYDQPSYSGTTAVNIHFISTGGNLSTVTGSTGRVVLETALVP